LNQFSFATLLPQQAEHAAEIVKPCLAVAERYGGSGIGFHGGGARAAIINEAVVKGVGRNQLTGIGGDNLHSTGDLHIYHAVKEVVLSNLLSKLLPLGVGDTHGLIYLDDEAEALEGEGESCIRVLLVRDHCLRLGSFLSPRNFKPHNKKNRSLILSHLAVRSIHLEIERAVSSKNLVEILGVCLQNHANQFAFARCALIAHNAISESNLCVDGRWIDLTVSGFVNSGKNYLQAS